MATTKTRINITVKKGTERALKDLAKFNQEPVATTANKLLEFAIEMEEDKMLSAIADERLKNHKGRWIKDSDKIWK